MEDKSRVVEIDDVGEQKRENAYPGLKLDERGLPLVPQPSDHKDDPLVSSCNLNVDLQR
jgi:hypothetical protein